MLQVDKRQALERFFYVTISVSSLSLDLSNDGVFFCCFISMCM